MKNCLPDSPPDSPLASPFNRRGFLRRAGIAGAAAAFAPAAAARLLNPTKGLAAGANEVDAQVLNFALNLEYLEAEFFANAVFGQGLEALGERIDGVGTAGPTTVKANPLVPFADPTVAPYAAEIARDEINHVRFLRAALGSAAVAKPLIDLLNSFNTAAVVLGIGNVFDPFATDHDFLFGAFYFEDVGVTAYHGATPLLTDRALLSAATGILAVEAYRASAIRSPLLSQSQLPGQAIFTVFAQGISDLHDSLDGGQDKDQSIVDPTTGAVNKCNNGLVLSQGRVTCRRMNPCVEADTGEAARTLTVSVPSPLFTG